ncbi:hypothetical protein GCM10011402_31050 [Paracoccus acridae]|uniref:Uncharacterized protein n=1 Tax=Paracoccus acridae TaxID=1795310 RepID=A0ABQ1VKN8_9RHOB|nr:hypothetical protein [Paracoccus acridae]GGF76075.1 hypothetical protein GCM10011402_31050 [Paracoccus acridae]
MKDILRLSLPLSVWIAAFSGVYGLEGVVCSDRGAGAGLGLGQGRAVLVVAWVVAIAVQVGLIFGLRTPRFASAQPWVQRVSMILACVALVATVWSLLPVVTTSLCL